MPSELFSFTSLPSLHYNIELSALSFSTWLCGLLLLLMRVLITVLLRLWLLVQFLHWVHPAEQELWVAREGEKWWGQKWVLCTAALPGLCRNKTPSVCLLGQKTCPPPRSTFALKEGPFGTICTLLVMIPFFAVMKWYVLLWKSV